MPAQGSRPPYRKHEPPPVDPPDPELLVAQGLSGQQHGADFDTLRDFTNALCKAP